MNKTPLPQSNPSRAETGDTLGYVNCWLGHTWSAWKDDSQGTLKDEGITVGYCIRQSRRCLECNKVQLRYAKVTT